MPKRFRIWRVNRRIKRLLTEAGMPASSINIFSGNVILTETRYPD